MRNFLDCIFNQRWIGQKGSATEFLPRSSDLTPLDLYTFGELEKIRYATKPQTLEELKDQIEHVINDFPLVTIQICHPVRRRRWECTVAEGGHFEHVRA